MDDSVIIELFRSRSEEAIKEAQKKYGDYCFHIAFEIIRNREDAEECVNDAMLRAWESIPPNEPEYLGAYLGRIVRNLAIDRLKETTAQKRGLGEVPLDISELEDFIFQPGSVWEEIDEKVLIGIINSFLDEQKKLYRIVFMQKYWYLMEIKKIAELNGISESKTASILHRLHKKLKKRLEKEGYTI